MCGKMKRCMFLMVVLAISSGGVFADAIWIAGDGNWSTASNWSTGNPPVYGEVTRISSGLSSDVTVTVDSVVTRPAYTSIGFEGHPVLVTLNIETGGDLRTEPGKSLRLGGNGIININGGTLVPWGAAIIGGEININDGIMSIGSSTWEIKSGSVITVNGGIFALSSLPSTGAAAINGGMIDIRAGRFRMTGDRRTNVEGYIDSGFLVAYGGDMNYGLEVTYDGTNTWVDSKLIPPSHCLWPTDGMELIVDDRYTITLNWGINEGLINVSGYNVYVSDSSPESRFFLTGRTPQNRKKWAQEG